jgi:aminopeptidase N
MPVQDPHSFADPAVAVMTHLQLDLTVDFEKHKLHGTAAIRYQATPSSRELIVDTRGLTIHRVTSVGDTLHELKYHLDAEVPFLGQALHIPLDALQGEILIEYTTSPDAAALQWLLPQQTAGKKQPFLFSQSQAILARTWAPVQDSPGIRFTYEARLKVPADLMAVMSAENPMVKNDSGVYTFSMKQPIPAYLLAIAVGDIAFMSLDNRSGVYAEPVLLERAANEFAELPNMIAAAEQLYGPYAWGRYDLIVLPPSFPFGGMENPRLTFATPTIIAGDRSLTTLVAHELAHSWSGNLVTNATWNDFWLNEGFTVYFENRIMESLYGKDFADMQRKLGQQDLFETLKELGDDNPDTRLKLSLEGRDPDDGMTDIAYEKGNNLLLVLEAHVGRPRWDAFLRNYFQRHAFKTMTTEDFLVELRDSLFANDSQGFETLKINQWVYEPGLPDNYIRIRATRFEAVEAAVGEWSSGRPATSLSTGTWTAFEWIHFLQVLPANLSVTQLQELDRAFGFSKSGNNEILFNWMECCLRNNYTAIYPVVERFLTEVGRRKYVKPLFQALVETNEGRAEAQKIFEMAKGNYHAITRETVEAIVNK